MTDNSSGRVVKTKRHSRLVNLVIRLVKEKPLGTVGGVITLILLLTGIFADFLAPYGMNEISVNSLAPPSARYWLGTDNMGRDLLSRVIFGARISVIVGLSATSLGTLIAVIIGMLCAYIGGKFDLLVQRFVDAMMCLPALVLLIVLMSLIGPGMLQIILVLAIVFGISGSRQPRAFVITIKENMYVTAAIAIGCSHTRIITRHLLPNIMPMLIVSFSTSVPGTILTEASLSFLGYGIPPPAPSWGGMLSGTGRSRMYESQWPIIWPGLALATVVYGINMFGDAVRDIVDPRLRGGVGRYGVRKPKKQKKGGDAGRSEHN